MTPIITFGQQIHRARRHLHMTQGDMALALGYDAQTLSNWECERTRPWPKQQAAILLQVLALYEPNAVTITLNDVGRLMDAHPVIERMVGRRQRVCERI